jgi:DNA-binding winged helix-turn-helix (wHTH) protein
MKVTKDGEEISIGPRTLDALLFLIQHRSEYVSRETLHKQLWRSEKISGSTIPMCIREIRRSLFDQAKSPRFIASAKGRGYRFIGTVRIRSDIASSDRSERDLPFIGRSSSIKRLQSALQSTITHLQGSSIAICGEAGVGKTRLVTEFLRQTSNRVEAIVSRAPSEDFAMPFAMWIQALHIALGRHPKNRKLADCAQRISKILPEIKNETLIARTGENKHLDRFRLYLDWVDAFRAVVTERPLILVLEDIHIADEDSLLLLEHLSSSISNIPVLLITTARPISTQTLLSGKIAKSWAFRDSLTLQVAPFSLKEVEALMDPFDEQCRKVAHDIFLKSGGNAFYATHLVRLHESSLSINLRTLTIILRKTLQKSSLAN